MIADFNKTHATNPKWTPHARFHVVWQISSYVGFGLLAFALIWWPGPLAVERLYLVALMGAIVYAAFFVALIAMPVYGGAAYDKNGYQPFKAPVPIFAKRGTPTSPSSASSWCCSPRACWRRSPADRHKWRTAAGESIAHAPQLWRRALLDEHLVAPLADHRQQPRAPAAATATRKQPAEIGRVRNTVGIAARDQHGAAQVLLHQRPEHEAEQQRRRLEVVLDQPIADQRRRPPRSARRSASC